ncbi:MAG TPA: response regulator [Flavobacteriales bacterium]|nr:response regulator [Flavobacteriales bacterium]
MVYLVILLVLGLLAAAYYVYLYMQKTKALEKTVDNLTRDLQDQKNSMTEQERYLAYTSHEIRTPLNAIAGGTQLLSKTSLDPKQLKYVTAISSAVDSALLIVNDILDLSKIDSNMVEVRPVDFMITEVMNGIKNIMQYRADQKGIEFNIHLEDKIPPVVKGDAKHLNQILINLSTNAVKFTDIGKVDVYARVVSEDEKNVKLEFKVVDTGKGMRKSSLPTIFNQFEQETRHTIKHAGGSGLGLAITKKLVELQKGTIEVDSQYLQGTTFTVVITYEKSVLQVKNLSPIAEIDIRKLDNIKVLLVDDNSINREILHDLLKDVNNNLEIVMAENGEIAINKMYHGGIDLVLMDIQMPKMNGYEATEHIRKNMKYPISEVPIVAMTAHALENVAETCFKAGMNDYVSKPIDIDLLVSKMCKLLDKRKVVQEKYSRYKVIDLNHLKELTKENEERIQKYIGIFLQNVPHDLEILRAAYNEKDYGAFKETAHKIKGNVAYMGIKNLTELFTSAEYGNLDKLPAGEFKVIFENIEKTCIAAIDELQEVKNVL